MQAHIGRVTGERDRLTALARPPEALFAAVDGDEELLRLGRGLSRAFSGALRGGHSAETDTRFDRARAAAESYLAHFPPARQRRMLLGALAALYSAEGQPSDAVAWLAGSDNSRWFAGTSIARQTIQALREVGVLGLVSADGK